MKGKKCELCEGSGELLTVEHGYQPCPQCCSREISILRDKTVRLAKSLRNAIEYLELAKSGKKLPLTLRGEIVSYRAALMA